jgi:hypothetical protein
LQRAGENGIAKPLKQAQSIQNGIGFLHIKTLSEMALTFV